jgi:glutamate/tyrosine decarboxylase-like PLP-dependent enzyme
MSAQPPDLAALELAAQTALRYRRDTAMAERTQVANYAAIHRSLAGPLPEHGSDPVSIIADLAALATPGVRPQTGPRFFGWVIGSSHPTGVAADWLTSAWGQNAGNVVASPAASAVEAVAAGWLLDILNLPPESSVGFATGATVANLVCLAAARSEMLLRQGWNVEADGLFGAPEMPVVIGADAHATVFVALKMLGFGAQRVITVASDELGRMRPDALAAAVAGCPRPPLVIAQAGQINTGACDPFEQIAPVVSAAAGWLHVDGAFGLWAQAAPARAHLTRGVELADSWATDGHKWLQTPYDCGFAIVRHAEAHRRAMAVSASYLPEADAEERDPSAYVPELSRRARGFATWAMLRQFGREGIAALVEQCCAIAAHIGETLARAPGVTVIAPVTLNQVMVRFADDDEITLAVVAAVQAEGVAYFGATLWRGKWVMRVSVTSSATTVADADAAVASVLRCLAACRSLRAAE